MKLRPTSACVSALALALGLLVAGGPSPAAAQVADEDAFRSFVEGLRDGTLPPALAVRECQRELAAQEDSDSVRQMMAGYLEVPERLALEAFCQSLVRAVEAGDVTAETAIVLGRNRLDADFYQAFGRLLRAVHFSHHLKAVDAVVERPAP